MNILLHEKYIVEPRYNMNPGTMKVTMSGWKIKEYNKLGPAKLLCYKKVKVYIRALYNEVPL